jgi:regulator of protease activity HflC (stomatin/prohibitin superfamily)
MAFIIIAVVLSLVIVGGLIAAFATKTIGGFFVAGVSIVLLLVLTAFSSATTVDARAVGIVTSFGKYQKTLDSGLHWTAPWAHVEQFSTTLEPANQKVNVTFSQGDRIDPVTKKPVKIVAGGGKGTLVGTARWQISADTGEAGARRLWEKYRTYDRVTTDLVQKSFYDKLANVANDFEAGAAVVSQDVIAKKVKDELAAEVAPYGVIIDSVSITEVALDNDTQVAVNNIYKSEQEIKTASNRKARAVIDAETVKLQQQAGSLSPQANQRFCLDVLNNWDAGKNGPAPATLNCGLGAGGAGVLVQAK